MHPLSTMVRTQNIAIGTEIFACSVNIHTEYPDGTTDVVLLDLDGQRDKYTYWDWFYDDPIISTYDEESRHEICSTLDTMGFVADQEEVQE